MFLTLTLTSNGWMSRALSDTRTIIRMRANICQTRSFRVQGQTRSAESCQPLEQVRFGSGVYTQSCPVMSQNARVCPVQCSAMQCSAVSGVNGRKLTRAGRKNIESAISTWSRLSTSPSTRMSHAQSIQRPKSHWNLLIGSK